MQATKYRNLVRAGLMAVAACHISAQAAATEGEAPHAAASKRHAQHVKHGLNERVQLLTKGLELDADQQVELRRLLERQRDEVTKVWNDASLPAPYRVSATQAISERTAEGIRTLLNEEQRKKYNPPRQPHAAAEGLGRRSVEDWMYPAKAPAEK
jgi:hypothetical protein